MMHQRRGEANVQMFTGLPVRFRGMVSGAASNGGMMQCLAGFSFENSFLRPQFWAAMISE